MTLLTEKRIRALKRAGGDQTKIDEILLEGALIQWRVLEAYERAHERRKLKIERQRQRRLKQEHADELRREERNRIERRRREKREQERKQRELIVNIIQLVTEKKVNPTHRFMKSVKDPELKRRLVEATCLSKV